jgi:endonuclease/exonuclease/phosphatase (EEP) superfamily protein YafD
MQRNSVVGIPLGRAVMLLGQEDMAASKPASEQPKPADAPEESKWRQRGRRILVWAIVLQLVGIALFIASLVVGERSRATLIALYLPRQPLLVGAILGALLAPLTRRAVRILVPLQIALILILLFPVMGFTVSSSRRSDHPIRLASYNVYFGKLGRPALLDEIAAMPADIILLQATYDSIGDRLRERFPDRHVHQEHELVLLSKFPIKKATVPPPLPDETPSMFVEYLVETPSGLLRLFNVHPFSPRHALFEDQQTGANIDHREAQIEAVVEAARKDGPPFVISGDTNLPVLSSIARRNLGRFKDAFEEVGFGFGYTFPAKRPWMRIDRVFADDGIRFLDFRVGPRGGSDHRPIFVDFEIMDGR